jgi:alpha-galactosidase
MYYAFFAGDGKPFKGEIELRGLAPGKYKVFDYANGRDLGTVDAASPKLATSFDDSLLLEVTNE